MGYNVPWSHDGYSLWAVLREPDLQAALNHEGDSASRNCPTHLLLSLAFLLASLARGMGLMNRLAESNQNRLEYWQSDFLGQN